MLDFQITFLVGAVILAYNENSSITLIYFLNTIYV